MLHNPAWHSVTQLNWAKVKECVEANFNEPTEELLSGEVIIWNVINPINPKDTDSGENDVDK